MVRALLSSTVALAVLIGSSIGSPVAKRAKTPISEDLFQLMRRYAAFSAAAYASDCPNPPYNVTITKQINEKSTNTQGYIARDDVAKEVIIAFRGTSNVQDFISDLNQKLVPYTSTGVTGCDGCQAHKGFLKAWNSVAQVSIDGVKAELDANPGYALAVTGHSLGASIASFATVSMIGSGLDPTAFTYGQPRTGNPAFADYVDQVAPAAEGKMYRITHANDGVPQTVQTKDGYRHHLTEFWQEDEATAAGTFQCEGQEPADCNNSKKGVGLGPGLIGINSAHLSYMGMSIGDPLDRGAKACDGKPPSPLGAIGGLLGFGPNN